MAQKNKTATQSSFNAFKQAVTASPEIAEGYCQGLQALGPNAYTIAPQDTKKLSGSVNLDTHAREKYPEDPRWDYIIGYEDKAYFLEIHPATNSQNITEMYNKARWLKSWLNDKALALKAITDRETLYWVPSGKCNFLSGSPERRKLAKNNILIVKPLSLPPK